MLRLYSRSHYPSDISQIEIIGAHKGISLFPILLACVRVYKNNIFHCASSLYIVYIKIFHILNNIYYIFSRNEKKKTKITLTLFSFF